jgi:hypothetical protein
MSSRDVLCAAFLSLPLSKGFLDPNSFSSAANKASLSCFLANASFYSDE